MAPHLVPAQRRPLVTHSISISWVITDMGGENAEITVDESVEGMKSALEGVTAADTGKFLRWNGTEHPW